MAWTRWGGIGDRPESGSGLPLSWLGGGVGGAADEPVVPELVVSDVTGEVPGSQGGMVGGTPEREPAWARVEKGVVKGSACPGAFAWRCSSCTC